LEEGNKMSKIICEHHNDTRWKCEIVGEHGDLCRDCVAARVPRLMGVADHPHNCPKHGFISRITHKGVASFHRDACPLCRADKAEAERDEARREICEGDEVTKLSLIDYAKMRGWEGLYDEGEG